MFTGLVQKIAKVILVKEESWGTRLVISCPLWPDEIQLGESICTSGCCLTVAEKRMNNGEIEISFDVIPETLDCTTLGSLISGSEVNIERSLRSDSLLGGHFVQGHVDGVEEVLSLSSGDDESRLRISMGSIDRDTVVTKGSITIDGVSLTIASVGDSWFEVALVPTTLRETTLGKASVGSKFNIETDILARTVVNVVRTMQKNNSAGL
jgi:riboflavin synthase